MQLRAERSEKSCRLIRAMSIYNLHLCVCGFWCHIVCACTKKMKKISTPGSGHDFSVGFMMK